MTAPPGDIPKLRQNAIEAMARIEQELMIASLNRQLYEEVRSEVVRQHPTSDATFLNSYSGLYARSQMMAIRRLADTDDSTDSLWQLIQRIRSNPSIASRAAVVERVRERSGDDNAADADAEFSLRYAGPAGPFGCRGCCASRSVVGAVTLPPRRPVRCTALLLVADEVQPSSPLRRSPERQHRGERTRVPHRLSNYGRLTNEP